MDMVPRNCRYCRHQPPGGCPGHLHFWPTGCKFRGSQDSLRFDISLEQLTNSGKLYTYYSFIKKYINQDQANWDMYGKVWEGPKLKALYPFPMESGHATLPAHQCVYQPRNCTELQHPEFLWWLHYVGMIDWITGLMTELNLQPYSPPWRSKNALIIWLVFLAWLATSWSYLGSPPWVTPLT